MAQAAASAARQEQGIEVRLLHASNACAEDLLHAQGYLFVTPKTWLPSAD